MQFVICAYNNIRPLSRIFAVNAGTCRFQVQNSRPGVNLHTTYVSVIANTRLDLILPTVLPEEGRGCCGDTWMGSYNQPQ